MLFGNLPFTAYTMDELKNEIRKKSGKNLPFKSNISISSHAKDLLTRMIEIDPKSGLSNRANYWPNN